MRARKQQRPRVTGKRASRRMVAAGRRLNGVWNVTTYLERDQSGDKQRGFFWQRASCT